MPFRPANQQRQSNCGAQREYVGSVLTYYVANHLDPCNATLTLNFDIMRWKLTPQKVTPAPGNVHAKFGCFLFSSWEPVQKRKTYGQE